MKKVLIWLLKAFFAGCLALALASLVSLVYYNPVPAESGLEGATQTAYRPSTFGSTMREGIAWGSTDAWGYYNADIPQGPIQILVMGSSHMQAVQVTHDERMPTRLGRLTGKTTYNIGVSGYNLLEVVKNLEGALDTMAPTEYLVIETASTAFSAQQIRYYLSGQVPPDAKPYSGGITALLQKIPYARLAYVQLKDFLPAPASGEGATPAAATQGDYDALMGYIGSVCRSHGVRPVLFYHSETTLAADGSQVYRTDPESLAMLAAACQTQGVTFVDMTADFEAMYRRDCRLPHGFSNTAVGWGHLNRYGHDAIAQRLAQVIAQLEAEKEAGK